MKDNPSVKVEIGSHTDSRASAEYNQVLSLKTVLMPLLIILFSQGIARDRIIAKGYGETKLLNECADGVNCTEAQHAINRRTEMKVICNKINSQKNNHYEKNNNSNCNCYIISLPANTTILHWLSIVH